MNIILTSKGTRLLRLLLDSDTPELEGEGAVLWSIGRGQRDLMGIAGGARLPMEETRLILEELDRRHLIERLPS